MPLSTFRTTEFLENYEKALDWMLSIGVNFNKASRLEIYRNKIDEFVSVFITRTRTLSEEQKEKLGRELVNSFIEAEELVYVYEALRHSTSSQIRVQLERVANGPISPLDESAQSSSNHGRNYAFELYVAAIIKNSGYGIIEDSEADLLFNVDAYSMFIECKRPLDASTIGQNAMKANRQLKKRFSASRGVINKRGLIALSLTKVFNPRQNIFRFENEEAMHREIQRDAMAIYSRYNDMLRDRVDRRIMGWIGLIRVPVIVNNMIADFSVYNYPIFVNITHSSEPEHETINSLGRNLKGTFEGRFR